MDWVWPCGPSHDDRMMTILSDIPTEVVSGMNSASASLPTVSLPPPLSATRFRRVTGEPGARTPMASAFELLRAYPGIGGFLAYQYVTDLNYSTLLNFSEMSFVQPGPGCISGIRKCFSDLGEFSEADIVKLVAERQSDEFSRLGLEFQTLWGRPLQLIDCQNLFCVVEQLSVKRYAEGVG